MQCSCEIKAYIYLGITGSSPWYLQGCRYFMLSGLSARFKLQLNTNYTGLVQLSDQKTFAVQQTHFILHVLRWKSAQRVFLWIFAPIRQMRESQKKRLIRMRHLISTHGADIYTTVGDIYRKVDQIRTRRIKQKLESWLTLTCLTRINIESAPSSVRKEVAGLADKDLIPDQPINLSRTVIWVEENCLFPSQRQR